MIKGLVGTDKISPIFLISIILLIFSVNIVYAADCGGSIPCNCGDIVNESRTFNASDSLTGCSDTGITINGTSIILDCAGYVINGTSGSSTIGVKINYGSDNTTVKNCTIHNFGTGIYGNASLGLNLTNNKIYNLSNYNGAGIFIADASQIRGVSANITNNNITSETGSGIFCSVGIANVINNSISGYDYGIESGFEGNWGQIKGNNITANYNLSGSVIFINSGSPNITENKITGGYVGIYLYTSGSPKVWHNNIYGQSSYKVNSPYSINLSNNNEGNYWGHGSCPVFIPGLDSNGPDVGDRYPYKILSGWLSESPTDCPPVWINDSIATPTNYSSSPSQFNITWVDNLGIDKVFITIRNSTGVLVNNASMTNSYGSSIYNYSIVLPAGTFNWTSYANDSAGNWSNSSTWAFTISKGPLNLSISFSPSNTVVYPTQTTTIGNDNNGGDDDVIYELRRDSVLADNTTPYQEIVTLPIGTYNYTFNATGGQNWTVNSTGISVLLTIQQSGFVPVGGSGDIPIYLVNRKKGNVNITITSVDAGDKQSVAILKTEDMSFRRVIVYAKNALNNIKIMVTKLEGLPASVTRDISGESYHYINVTIDNFADPDLDNATIEFAIPKSWLEDNNIDRSNITLYRWQNQNWNALPTTQISQTDTEVFYSAVTSGFSYFVIGTIEIITAAPTACVENWICTEWSSCVDGKETKTCTDSHDCGTEANKPETSRDCILEQILVGAEDLGLGGILVASGIILAIVVMILFLVKEKKMDLSFLKRKKKFKYKYKHKSKK